MGTFPLPQSEGDRVASFVVSGALRGALGPLRILLASPTALFLLALATMLFWHSDVPFHEINRWTFGILVVSVAGGALISRKPVAIERASFPMIGLALLILASMIGRRQDADTAGVFAAKYLVPFLLFHLAKIVFEREKQFRHFEVLTFVVLLYLSFTSIAFLVGARALVFPQFILDPGLGYHAERARGPFLQPVANGVSINLLGLLVWHAYRRGSIRGMKPVLLLASVPIAILATLTRAVWLAFAGSVIAVLFLSKSRRLRLAGMTLALAGVGMLAIAMSTTSLGHVVSDRVEESSPVDYRMAVYAGGWQMFLERPLMGWGFHQMPQELPRYVSEFQDKVLYPHNTYLEVLVENGLVGLILYVWLMWELFRLGRGKIPGDEKAGFLDANFHRFWPIFLAVYWINAAVVGDELSLRERSAVHDGRDVSRPETKGKGTRIMLTIAYLANQFPSPVEPYVIEEIGELRGRGVRVIAGSVADMGSEDRSTTPEIVVRRRRAGTVLQALSLCMTGWSLIVPLVLRIIFGGTEGLVLRLKALVHTWWGACYAVQIREFGVDHIHVHHGFSASWIGMVAARLLGIEFSMTLHGSDLLIYRTYLDVKLQSCAFCLTVSEYNRCFLLAEFPGIDADKIVVSRLGVDIPVFAGPRSALRRDDSQGFRILSVGRLNSVKDHAFLIRACAELRARGIEFHCEIAGEGPEKLHLQSLIGHFGLGECVHLFGHANRDQLDALYARADVVVLTSRSEGIPLVLMEAMARGKLVLAPSITGIPELVIPGQTGFLYQPASMDDFLERLIRIHSCLIDEADVGHWLGVPGASLSADGLNWIRHAAQVHVQHNFDRKKNLKIFADLLLQRIRHRTEEIPNESVVLQQI